MVSSISESSETTTLALSIYQTKLNNIQTTALDTDTGNVNFGAEKVDV